MTGYIGEKLIDSMDIIGRDARDCTLIVNSNEDLSPKSITECNKLLGQRISIIDILLKLVVTVFSLSKYF